MLKEFIEYLIAQLGQPYLWGGQHTKLTPENYKSVIARHESDPEKRHQVEAYCEEKFANGVTVLYAYDCSGLGVYWLYNLKHLWPGDVTANTMMGRCILKADPPKKGWWVFKCSGSKATHIGYMVDDTTLIEAKGRKYGVVRTTFKASEWDRWGIPRVFEDEIIDPPVTGKFVVVVGGSVNVRNSDSKAGRVMFVAHKGDIFPYIETAPSGWYEILTDKGNGFITNLPKYTKLEG